MERAPELRRSIPDKIALDASKKLIYSLTCTREPRDMPSKYAKGCDLSKVPKAADVQPADLKALLAVDSSNPSLRALRIQQGFLTAASLPVDLRLVVPRLPIEEKKT